MSEFNLTRIDRMRYRPTKFADNFLNNIRSSIMASDKATVARLAIARSLSERHTSHELELGESPEYGNAIEGVHLFGDDHDLWACLICASVDIPVENAQAFRALVESHWHRGAMLLKDDYNDVDESDVSFVIRLANMLPQGASGPTRRNGDHTLVVEARNPVRLNFGSESVNVQTDEEASFVLNAPGRSPHLAIMGKTRSGKSRTGLDIAASIIQQTHLPVLLIDPKGEFVKNGALLGKPEWQGETLERYFPGIRPLDVPRTPIPLDFLWRPADADRQSFAQLAMGFRDSFQKCLRAKGDVALDLLRGAVFELLQRNPKPISLTSVLEAYMDATEDEGRSAGSIAAKLREIDSLSLFDPVSSPAEFYSSSWVVSFGDCSDEPKRLAIFLMLDALNTFLLSLPDSDVDAEGHRALRHLLIIDEAREILSYRHGALSALVRKSASKGGVTMLLSQGPDDFDQEEDDFLEQMGTIGAFALSSSNVKALTGALGKKMKVEDFSDRVLPPGVALVKLPGEAPMKIQAWK